jgi:hypothetical protein
LFGIKRAAAFCERGEEHAHALTKFDSNLMDALRRSVEASGSARAAPRPERPGIIAAGQAREDAPAS